MLRALLSLLAGTFATASLAPFNLSWLAPLPPLFLYLLLRELPLRQTLWHSGLFGVGFFGAGVSWVYVSISEHSATPQIIALLLTALFVLALALLFVVQGGVWKRWLQGRFGALSFVGLWVLFEWLRSWLLTGFPWLYLGYATLDTPLAAWAPVGGVWLTSLMMAGCGIALLPLFSRTPDARRLPALLLIGSVLVATLLLPQRWTQDEGEAVSVAIVQADIEQASKWNPRFRDTILTRYSEMTLPLRDNQLIIWPETAIPAFLGRALPQLSPLLDALDHSGSTLVSGLPTFQTSSDGRTRYHNSIAVLSNGSGTYHKQRLVPFGEYVPLENALRGTLEFFNLPMSSFSLPADIQPLLEVNGLKLAPALCYEIAYPELVRRSASQSGAILTVSNDTWFGRSIAPDQHMQIARMRALENGRWVIRGTNNGISGLIDPQGNVVAQAPRYQPAVLSGTIQPQQGLTPYQRFGSWPVLGFCLLLCIAGGLPLPRRANTP